MNRNSLLLGLLATSLIPTHAPLAQEETKFTAELSTGNKRDIDFDTNTVTIGAQAITPYGLLRCDVARETGETRIDTFDNIFGTTSVLAANWNDYSADQLRCGYGVKMPLNGGELSGGIGTLRYRGETDVTPDGKEIELDAMRLSINYTVADYETRMQLVDKRYSFLYHHLVPTPYDSITDGRIRTLSLQGKWGPVHAEMEETDGRKEKDFTTPLFPYADFTYRQHTLSLGPRLNGALGPFTYIAPTFVSGSERGSFNELDLDSGIRGLVAGMTFGETKVRLSYLDLNSDGTRAYLPVTTDLAEEQHTTRLAVEVEGGKWGAKLENNHTVHDGYVTVNNVVVSTTPLVVFPYAVIVSCGTPPCDYDNVRDEDEWKLALRYNYNPQITLRGELYQRERKDRQFELDDHNYRESGGTLGVAVTF